MEFQLGEQYPVVVQKILTGGIIVEFENGETEFIHKSKISNDFINDINEFVAVGEKYTATVVVGKNKPTELSLRDSNQIVRKPATESHKVVVQKQVYDKKSTTPKVVTLEDMISQSTSAMREKYQGRDKTTGARYKKSRRGKFKNKD